MELLVIGRDAEIVATATATFAGHGITATGVTLDAEAIDQIAAGTVTHLLIGGGVEPGSRKLLRDNGAAHGVEVIDVARGGRPVQDYISEVLVPRLRKK